MNAPLGKVIYNGLVGIAFGARDYNFAWDDKNNLEVTKFVNVQNHREWIEAIIYGKKTVKSLEIRNNRLNKGRMARGNARTAELNISLMIWFNLIFMLSIYFSCMFLYPNNFFQFEF